MFFRRDVMVREPTMCVSTSNFPHQNVVIWTGTSPYGQDQMGSKSTTHVITGAEIGPDSNWPREESNEQRNENANLNPNHFVSWCGESRHHGSCTIEYYLPIYTDDWIMEHQRYDCARDGMFQMKSSKFFLDEFSFVFLIAEKRRLSKSSNTECPKLGNELRFGLLNPDELIYDNAVFSAPCVRKFLRPETRMISRVPSKSFFFFFLLGCGCLCPKIIPNCGSLPYHGILCGYFNGYGIKQYGRFSVDWDLITCKWCDRNRQADKRNSIPILFEF